MVQAAHPHWRRKRSGKKTRDLVVDALLRCGPLTALEIACEVKLRCQWVCVALDDLRIRGRVESGEQGKFQLVRAGAIA